MQIKRLELQGFKSFKDKTVIHFDDGITGIVGPNGCGKSNVVDAFFWVLGEQNARLLRGQSMDDLIFSGADKAPPAAFAEVTLVLEMPAELAGPNAAAGASAGDAALSGATREVSITRKLYRSGESEYMINKTPCRLRDIQELFMDTGVGARGYSIIQQGQIAKLVQAKPEDRRTMVEEVAGIVKYKTRRKESMRKLEGTQQNLLRVADVLNELETQKRQMERQAEKARKYKEWKERLQRIELQFNALKWEDLIAKLGSLEKEAEELTLEDASLTASRENAETQIAAKRLDAAQAAKISEEFQSSWIQAGQNLNNVENEHKYSLKNLQDLNQSAAQLQKDAEEEKSLVEKLKGEYEALLLESASIDELYAQSVEAQRAAEDEAQAQKRAGEELETESERQRRRLFQIGTEIERAESQAELAKLRLQEISANLERLSQEKEEREQALTESRAQKEALSQNLASARGSLETAGAELSAINARLSETQQSLQENRRLIARLSADQARAKSTLNALEEQKRRHEGGSKGVQTVFQKLLQQDERFAASVHGTLADMLSVQQGMETAVETALGRSLDLILTSESTLHDELSSLLKSGEGGRAAFADVAKLRGQMDASALSSEAIPAAALSSFVSLQPGSAGGADILLQYLARNVFVADTSEQAKQLSGQYPQASFVTREGMLFRGGWFMEGGDTSTVSGAYVARNRELAELSASSEALGHELDNAQANLSSLEAELSELENSRHGKEEEIRGLQSELSRIGSEEAALSVRAQEAERSLTKLVQEMERIQAEHARLSQQEIENNAKAESLSQEREALEVSSQEAQSALQASRLKLEELQHALMEARIRCASVTSQKNSMDSRLAMAKSELEKHSHRVESMLETALRKQEESASTSAKIEILATQIAELRANLLSSEQLYREAKERMDLLNNEVEELRSAAQTHSAKERDVKEALFQRRSQIERLQSDRDHLLQNTFERYGLMLAEYCLLPETQEQVMLLRNSGESVIQETKNEVTLLNEKIRKLGDVNPAAVEEYEAIMERYNLLSTQKADLEKSMADLNETIEKINHVSKERFERAFHEVNNHFKRVFPVIFGGGHAHLTLTNPEDLLETGVDIMAQPPGKKPQNINLLSGGEKTLTAISLLFSVFLVKPSPFCLLDEVDAPLDDANIGRFNALLREMSKRSQFIIITHNKRTMELNDKLYGVTMEDAGVSKMVSIQLSASA